MPVYLDKILFQDEFNGTYSGGADTGTSNLMGCVGDFIYATIDCHVAWSLLNFTGIFNSATQTITLDNTNGYNFPPQLTKSSSLFSNFVNNSFINNGFKVGDSISITGTTAGVNDGNYTIKTLTDTVITVNETIPHTASYTGVNVYGTTTVNGMDFYYNILGGSEGVNFESKTDKNTLQRFSGVVNNGLYGSFTLQPNTTSQAWWQYQANGISCVPTVTNNGVVNYQQKFTIVFPFLITPLFLTDQLPIIRNIQNQLKTSSNLNTYDYIKPKYFIEDCLNFIYQIDFKYAITNPSADQSSYEQIDFGQGNTSWFNSFFPSGVKKGGAFLNTAQYSTQSVVYTDNSGNVLTSIDVNNVTNVAITINAKTTVVGDNDPFVVNFMGLPINQGTVQGYQYKSQVVYREAFLYDRCLSKLGAVSSNGDAYGTDIQAITNVVGVVVSTTQFTISFKIDLGSLSKKTLAKLALTNNANYLIWVTPQDAESVTLITSNRSAIVADSNLAFVDLDEPSLLTIFTNNTTDVRFYNTETNDIEANPYTDFKGFSGGFGVAKCDFIVQAGCIVNSITVGFEVEIYTPNDYYYANEIVDRFSIESWAKTTKQLYDTVTNQINISESRNYLLPIKDIRNQRSIKRNTALDRSGNYGYRLLYGFQLDYHYWQNLQNWTAEYEKYHAKYWALYTQGYTGVNSGKRAIADGYGSNIKFKIVWEILNTITNNVTEFISYSNVSAYDNGNNTIGTTVVLDTTDTYGTSLYGSIPKDIPFAVVATFTNAAGFNPTTSKVEIILNYNNGNTEAFDRITTADLAIETPNSFFTTLPKVTFSNSNEQADLFVTLDLRTSLLPLKNCNIFVKITY